MTGELVSGCPVRVADPEEMEGRVLRLPNPADPIEAPLAAANQRSIDLAAETLSRLFPNLPLARFAQATDATTLVVGHSTPELLAELDPEAQVERMFQRYHFDPSRHIRFVRDKEQRDPTDLAVQHLGPYPGGRARLRPAALADALDAGFTMVLDGVELRDAASIRLVEMFERLFGCAVNINGYLSTRTYTSFGAHWDDQEVVILQLLGQKDWRVERPVALSPLKSSHGKATSGQTVWEGRITPGDAVYIPRGWGHVVSGIDELTYHYTITIPRIHGVAVLQEALSILGKSQPPDGAGRMMDMTPGRATSTISEHDDDETETTIRSALAQVRFSLPSRATQMLRPLMVRDLDLTARYRCPNPGGWAVAGTSGGETLLGMSNTIVALPTSLVGDVATMTDGSVHEVRQVDPELIAGLSAVGFIEMVGADPEV